MRYFTLAIVLATLMLSSCTYRENYDRLAYQDTKLYVEGEFSIGGEQAEAALTLEAPEYDTDGRMLARNAVLTFGENSIISGVSFEFNMGEVYVSTGNLRIPISDTDAVSGIGDIISLFCISEDSFYSSEKVKRDGVVCDKAVYVNGENRVEIILDTERGLPTDISALIDGRRLACDIKTIRSE